MNTEIVKILTLQIAAIISPVIFSIALIILSQKKNASKNAFYFMIGSVLVAIIVILLGLIIGKRIGPPNIHQEFGKIIDVLLIIIFIFLGLKTLFGKANTKNNISNLESLDSRKFLKIGFMINLVNLNSIVALFAASKEIPLSSLNIPTAILLAIFGILCFSVPVSVPLIIYLIFPTKAQTILTPINTFFTKYGKYIVGVVFMLFALYFFKEFLK